MQRSCNIAKTFIIALQSSPIMKRLTCIFSISKLHLYRYIIRGSDITCIPSDSPDRFQTTQRSALTNYRFWMKYTSYNINNQQQFSNDDNIDDVTNDETTKDSTSSKIKITKIRHSHLTSSNKKSRGVIAEPAKRRSRHTCT